MLLSLVVHVNSLRYWIPAAALLGMAPAFVLGRLAGLLLLPRRARRRMDDRMYALYQRAVLCFFENFTAVEVVVYGDIPAQRENVIYIANHQSTVDWVVADMVAVRQGALGDMRYILKDGLKWLPLYGWYFSQHGGTYVKRSLKFDEKMMVRKLHEYVKMDSPMFLVIFPEGTRYNPELPQAIEASQSFAEKEGLDVLNHVLTPRVKATEAAIAALRGHVRAIYDVTVAYEGSVDMQGKRKAAPTMPEFLCGTCPRVHIHFERLDLHDVPNEGLKFKWWLHKCFQKKDRDNDQLPSIGTILCAERWCCQSSLLGYWAQSWTGHHSDTGYQQAGTHFTDLGRMTGRVNPWYYFNSKRELISEPEDPKPTTLTFKQTPGIEVWMGSWILV